MKTTILTRCFVLFLGSLLVAWLLPAAAAAEPYHMKLFLLIGQSNMAGRGPVEAQDKVPHPRVFVLTKGFEWVPAVDPLHFDKPAIAGVGLGSTFGRAIADAEPDAVIGLIPAAFGGTSLDEWKPGGPLYNNAVARAKAAMVNGKLAGILWHQGEADNTKEKLADYATRFASMMIHLRADLDANQVPLVVGEVGHFFEGGAAINAAIATLPANVPLCAFVSSEELTDKGDKTHFDSASYRELGRRYAKAWTELAKK